VVVLPTPVRPAILVVLWNLVATWDSAMKTYLSVPLLPVPLPTPAKLAALARLSRLVATKEHA